MPRPPEPEGTGCLALFFAGFLVLASIVVICVGIGSVLQSYAMRSAARWPIAKATVVGTEVTEHTSFNRRRSVTTYVAKIEYRFVVDGRDYVSGGTHPMGWESHRTREAADEHLRAYPVGEVLMVHYNPRNPSEAYLDVAARAMDVLKGLGLITIGLVILVPLGVGLWQHWRKLQASQREVRAPARRSRRRRVARDDDVYD